VTPPEPTDPLTAAQGDEAFGPEDAAYAASTFLEVRDAIFAGPRYYSVWGGPGTASLPNYPLHLGDLVRRILQPGRYPFAQAARRTVDSRADLRWGPDRKGVRRLLHPNGVCLTGTWEVTEPTDYTGYFAPGSRGLVVARYSASGDPWRGGRRSLSMVGKVYPTDDRDSPERFRPAGFITQEDFGGSGVAHLKEAEFRNAPDTRAWKRGATVFAMLAVTALVFRRTDGNPTFRQLHEVAELGKPPGVPTKSPQFLRLTMDETVLEVPGDRLDFREEILAQIYDGGNPEPRRTLTFNIEVSDDGYTTGPAFYQRRIVSSWRRVGRIVFTEAIASYNGDFVVHFHHPGWRTDRNDPATALRHGGERVR